jgi:hypothetical protein
MSLVNMTSFLLNFSVSVTLFFSTFSKRPRKYRETVRFAGHDQHSSTDLLKRTRAIFFFAPANDIVTAWWVVRAECTMIYWCYVREPSNRRHTIKWSHEIVYEMISWADRDPFGCWLPCRAYDFSLTHQYVEWCGWGRSWCMLLKKN